MSETPTRIGPYAIERRLGAGGMAETFVALRRMQSIEQRVCLKRILPAYASNETARRLFSREANITAKLRHANLVQVLDVGEDANVPYLVMELVEGTDLDHLLERAPGKRLPPELVGFVLAEVAHGLHEAHGGDGAHEGVVHRDLSPSNVLLSTSGEVKVADFGIAKALSGDKATATMMRGKFAYMAPEQLDGAPLDPRADMWALGVMGFEMLAGERPFDAPVDARLIMLITKNERRSIHELVPDAPRELRDTIEALLAPKKEDRPKTGHDVVERLAPMLPAAMVARRQLGKLVTAAHDARMEKIAREATAAAASVGTAPTVMASAGATPPTRPAAGSSPQATPMVVTAPQAGATPTSAPAPAAAAGAGSGSRTGIAIGLAALFVGVIGIGGAYVALGSGAAPATTTVPATAIAVPAATAVVPIALPTTVGGPPPTTLAPPATTAPAEVRDEAAPQAVGSTPPPSEVAAAETDAGTAAHESGGAERGRVHVVASPWGLVWIDGRFVGRAPVDAPLRAGSHRIQGGFTEPTVTRNVRVRAGEDVRVELEVE